MDIDRPLNGSDTAGPCDNNGNNAFVIARPWTPNVFGNGQHTIVSLLDGVQFAGVMFQVATFGTVSLFEATASFMATYFPDPAADVKVKGDAATRTFR